MKRAVLFPLWLAFVPVLFTAASAPAKIKTLDAPKRAEAAVIDGRADDAVWQTVPARTDFLYPWRKDEPQKTSLKVYHDDANLYFLFEVEDRNPLFAPKQADEMDIVGEDRVEVYFEAEPPMKNYYSIEMSPTGLALDYQCSFHRKFDYAWSFPELKLAGEKRKDGYVVEAAYPLSVLKELGALKADGTIRAGFFRADFEYGPDQKIVEKWISWIDPKLPEEDFHVPETIGVIRLLDR